MKELPSESFPADVARKLKTYVYRLIDPRNGETFYLGKGQGNRVFSHIRAEQNLEGDDLDNKVKRIREIRLAGFEVAHVIHRHGMDEKTAFEVEAALIDAYPGLTNAAGGAGDSTHWEFDYNTLWYDRLCPMTYFGSESQARINAIWAKVGTTYDGRYPDICSGDYLGKDK